MKWVSWPVPEIGCVYIENADLKYEVGMIHETLNEVFSPLFQIKFSGYIAEHINDWDRLILKCKGNKVNSNQYNARNICDLLKNLGMEEFSLLLTEKDLSKPSLNFVFGLNSNWKSVVSNARFKSKDGRPTKSLEVPRTDYIDRLINVVIHEMGHNWVIDAPHYINHLGRHCRDDRCVMHQFNCLNELDRIRKRRYEDFLCQNCKQSLIKTKEKNKFAKAY